MQGKHSSSQRAIFLNPMIGSDTEIPQKRENKPGVLWEIGTSLTICNKLEGLMEQNKEQKQPIKDATLWIQGDQIKSVNSTCLCLTVIGGCLLCLPWLCFGCRWWKKTVWPAFEIPLQTYNKLEFLLRIPTLKTFHLIVTDNAFDKDKAECIKSLLEKSSLSSFKFVNMASGFNWKNKQYSKFEQNMIQIKSINSIKSYMKWNKKIIA